MVPLERELLYRIWFVVHFRSGNFHVQICTCGPHLPSNSVMYDCTWNLRTFQVFQCHHQSTDVCYYTTSWTKVSSAAFQTFQAVFFITMPENDDVESQPEIAWATRTLHEHSVPNRVASILKGSHSSPAQWTHQVTAVGLFILQTTTYEMYLAANADTDQMAFEQWRASIWWQHPQVYYWNKLCSWNCCTYCFDITAWSKLSDVCRMPW